MTGQFFQPLDRRLQLLTLASKSLFPFRAESIMIALRGIDAPIMPHHFVDEGVQVTKQTAQEVLQAIVTSDHLAHGFLEGRMCPL